MSPYDTAASAALRFLAELAAWIAGPWGAAELTGRGWVAVPVAAVLVALPAVFSTPGDKHQVVVATPGPVRLALEAGLWAVAVAGAVIAWPGWAAFGVVALVAATIVTGMPRARWLLRGAPIG